MKQAILTLFSVLLYTVGFAQQPAPPASVTIKWAQLTYDFGRIPQGTPAVGEFQFTNTGKTKVVITSISSGCPCLVGTSPNKPVLPGNTDVIRVAYDAKGLGMFMKQVMVKVAGNNNAYVLNVRGEVVAQ